MQLGFQLADRVTVVLATDDTVASAIDAHGAWIAGEVLATELRRVHPEDLDAAGAESASTVQLDGHTVGLSLKLAPTGALSPR